MFINYKEADKNVLGKYFYDVNLDYKDGWSDFFIPSDMPLDDFHFVIEENKVKAGFKLMYTTELTGENQPVAAWLIGEFNKYLGAFKEQFPTAFIYLNDYYDWQVYEAAGYTKTLSTSSFAENREYHIESLAIPCDNPYVVRDYYESKMFPDVDVNDLSFEVWNRKAIRDHVDSLRMEWIGEPYWGEPYGSTSVVGFHYLGGTDMSSRNNDGIRYLVARCGKTLIGVVKFGFFGEETSYQSVSYIDVNVKYRQNGIAKMLAKKLNENLFPNVPLHLTDTSEMGKLCKMEEYFKESISSVPCFSYRELMDRAYA